ncbi:MAG: hypothetical protein Q7K57_48640 [Burkholderiaceae bacterium]|nr:hypothetical protein [Burkholderiaceae bacterium]
MGDSIYESLSAVAAFGLGSVEVDSVQSIALWTWYGDGVPDLKQIRGLYREELLLLLDRLVLYKAVVPERRTELQSVLKKECQELQFDTRAFQAGYRNVLPMLQSLHTRPLTIKGMVTGLGTAGFR